MMIPPPLLLLMTRECNSYYDRHRLHFQDTPTLLWRLRSDDHVVVGPILAVIGTGSVQIKLHTAMTATANGASNQVWRCSARCCRCIVCRQISLTKVVSSAPDHWYLCLPDFSLALDDTHLTPRGNCRRYLLCSE